MSLTDNTEPNKRCYVYCGEDRCNCQGGVPLPLTNKENNNMNYVKVWIVTLALLGTAAFLSYAFAEKYTPYQMATYCYNIAEFARTTVKIRDMGITEQEYMHNMDENKSKFRLDEETYEELLGIAHEIYVNSAQDPDGAFDYYMMSCAHPKNSI